MGKSKNKSKCIHCGKPLDGEYDEEYCCFYRRNDIERENAYAILAEIGVPFSDGEPQGIGDGY